VSQLSLDHKGGTKSYHIYVIETADNRSVFVNRWGKTGQFGELQTKQFPDAGAAWKEFTSKEQTKTRNGYYPKTGTKTSTCNNLNEFKAALGVSMFNKIGKEALEHIDPTIDTSSMRSAEPPKTADGELRHVNDTTRKADVRDALAAQAKAEAEAVAAAYADNPMFGRF
jgi:predicted DNA-binding WGR domain protein